MGIPPDPGCDHPIRTGTTIHAWARCNEAPTRLVTFPRRPAMHLCVEHEREASEARASVAVAAPPISNAQEGK